MASSGIGVVAADSTGDNSTIVNSDEYNIEEETTVVDTSNDNIEDSIVEEDTIVADGSTVVDNTVISTDDDTTYISSDDDTAYVNTDDDTIIANNSSVYDDVTYISSDDDTNINDSSYYEYSPESQTNIQYEETNQVYIDNSQTVSVDVKNDNSVVNNIYFESTKDSGKATVVVEDLKDKTCLTEKPPAGTVYKSFNIWIDNGGAANNIENAAVNFKVEKSWLKANSLGESSIVLNMYDKGKWVEVPITITGQDSQYVYFTAEVSEYSSFAITSKTVVVNTLLEQSDSKAENNSEEEIDGATKSEIIHLLEYIIELLK